MKQNNHHLGLAQSQRAIGQLGLQSDSLPGLLHAPALSFGAVPRVPGAPSPALRLIRLDEINDEKHQAYRQALANVYAALDPGQNARLVYLLEGSPKGVALYFGMVATMPKYSATPLGLPSSRYTKRAFCPGSSAA